MAVNVGNLLTDPLAQSFISLADAISYIGAEGESPWLNLDEPLQEASLIRVSRWMAGSLDWCKRDLDAADLVRVGLVAARLAVSAMAMDLYASADVRGPLKRAKAGSTEVEWAGTGMEAYQAGGQYWPWLTTMLKGLLCAPRSGIGILVI